MSMHSARQQIAWEAARLLFFGHETVLFRAKLTAARQLFGRKFLTQDLPHNSEIQQQVQVLAGIYRPSDARRGLQETQHDVLTLMQALAPFHPRFLEDTLPRQPAQATAGDSPHVAVFCNDTAQLLDLLDLLGKSYVQTRQRQLTGDAPDVSSRIVVRGSVDITLIVFPAEAASSSMKARITGQPRPGLSTQLLEEKLRDPGEAAGPPDIDPNAPPKSVQANPAERFQVYEMLLLPLAHARQNPVRHPEGDALFHSLQVFELVRDKVPYDEELLTAALLHDVGKAIRPKDPLPATLQALAGYITDRTAWLIENLPQGHAIREGTIGPNARRRLSETVDYDELMLLTDCDRKGRARTAVVPEVAEALEYLRDLADECGE